MSDIQDDETKTGNPQTATSKDQNPFAVLRKFVKPRAVVERCEMCSATLPSEHEHLVEPATRQMVCACQACAILFSGQGTLKYRRVPRRIRYLSTFQLTDAQWDGLTIPINMAFFFYSTPARQVLSLYPSPAGATESMLDLESWNEIVEANPILESLEPDTEALLINRVRGAGDYYLVPIDECYKLVGLIRTHWRGLSGGSEVWEVIGKFFEDLKEKSGHELMRSSAENRVGEERISQESGSYAGS